MSNWKPKLQVPAWMLCRMEKHTPVRIKTVSGLFGKSAWLIACKHCGQAMGYQPCDLPMPGESYDEALRNSIIAMSRDEVQSELRSEGIDMESSYEELNRQIDAQIERANR